jgi:hypothetical protein
MNKFIVTILDQILAVAEIDPECVHPDALLGRDFGVPSEQIHEIFLTAAKRLHVDVKLSQDVKDASPKQLVDLLQSCDSAWSDLKRVS